MKDEKITKQDKSIFWIPIVFLPIVLTRILYAAIKPPYWWESNIIYALACWLTLVTLWFMLRKYGYRFKDIGWDNFKARDIGWAVMFFAIAIYVWWGLSIGLSKIGIGWEMEYHFASPFEVFIIFFFAVITAPICEETFFRGYLITILNGKTRLWLACVFSIVLFALYHFFPFGIGAFILILFWSVFPTILFVWRKSIYPGIIMHALNNLFAWVMLPLLFGG
ncbi:MAG: type II CAAX endopeptidase family protein [Candidatus Aerophobetes bacterium]|nr:type II CAAX endopeptidase family protein [Candidatus Aerophobetes bacterium]